MPYVERGCIQWFILLLFLFLQLYCPGSKKGSRGIHCEFRVAPERNPIPHKIVLSSLYSISAYKKQAEQVRHSDVMPVRLAFAFIGARYPLIIRSQTTQLIDRGIWRLSILQTTSKLSHINQLKEWEIYAVLHRRPGRGTPADSVPQSFPDVP